MNGGPLFGCGTTLVTPFTREGAIDEPALRALIDWQIEEGVHFLVPCGATGEAGALTMTEHTRVVEITVDQAAGRVPVVAGAGANGTARAIIMSKEMQAAGATHLLHVSPMFNLPPQRGILAHFRAIADAVDLPIVAYNVPRRTGSNMTVETMLELARIENVVAIKEASSDLQQVARLLCRRPPGFGVLSGDDALTLPIMVLGGDGVISVVSNATPRPMVELVEACAADDFATARAMHELLTPWMNAVLLESNPIPTKAALAMLRRVENVLRLPLVPLADEHVALVEKALAAAGELSL